MTKYILAAVLPLMSVTAGCSFIGGGSDVQKASRDSSDQLKLWYDKPASKWVQALPVGNGRLGAMIFGQPGSERLQLNEITVWSGAPQPDADRKDAYKSLPELRQLIRDGKYAEAARFANARFNGPAPYEASYQALGDLKFEFQLPDGAVTNYTRWLDIDSALAGVRFAAGNTEYQREVFCSAPDQVLVQWLTSSTEGGLNFTMKLTRPASSRTQVVGNDTLVMTGNTDMPRLKGNLDYEADARILVKGGRVTGAGDGLKVEGANEAIVLVTCGTSFALDYSNNYRGANPHDAAQRLEAAARKSYAQLKSAHVADYQKYFHRVSLGLGRSEADKLPTDERLKKYGDGKSDPGFVALFYQFGRYLMICCSRTDNPLPANLQGLWGDGLDLPWKSDYHANINVQMIYWPAEPANLGEMHLPLLNLITNLVAPGTKTAKAYFGPDTPGWLVGYTVNGWSWTSPGERLSWGIWFGGSGWLCRHLWEHYAYTQDKDYLRKVYPAMRGAAEFWLANLVEGQDGKLITSPSSSPENSFITDSGITAEITEGATMDRSIVWDLLDKTACAAGALGVDAEFKKKLEAARDRIRPLQIGKAGQLMEWNGDWDLNSRDPHHRHVSHLYALHPSDQINVPTMPELAAAAKKSLELRGDDGTGWSIAWKENMWARLRDGDHCLRLLSAQLRSTEQTGTVMANAGGTYPNLFDAHPPFQIDGNFGAVAGISEMLLGSQEHYTDPKSGNESYVIDILPALPKAWPTGSVKGLRARGGFEVDIEWRDAKLVQTTVHSLAGGVARLRYGSVTRDITLAKGRIYEWNGQ
jgi:alpha-L-fucosidase 2